MHLTLRALILIQPLLSADCYLFTKQVYQVTEGDAAFLVGLMFLLLDEDSYVASWQYFPL